jgi:hypothetical protein
MHYAANSHNAIIRRTFVTPHSSSSRTPYTDRSYPEIFARRSALWKHMPRLTSYLGLDLARIPLAERQAHTPDAAHQRDEQAMLTPAHMQALLDLYAPLNQILADVGDFLVRGVWLFFFFVRLFVS